MGIRTDPENRLVNSAVYDHPDWRALVAGIIAAPAADLPRLVAADWLEERCGSAECGCGDGVLARNLDTGEPMGWCLRCGGTGRVSDGRAEYAEFIRLQCESALTPTRMTRAWGRSCGLFVARSREWFGSLAVLAASERPWPGVVELVVRRGFVAEVRCPLAYWCGGECPCGGWPDTPFQRRVSGPSPTPTGPDGWCRDCGGTGDLPAHGPALVRRHPVETVTITDREPWPRVSGGGYWWTPGEHTPSDLPAEIIARIAKLTGQPIWEHGGLVFATREVAVAALSAACLTWAKETSP